MTPTPAAQSAAMLTEEVTDDMALAFHRALTDGDIGADDLEDIKRGLRAALQSLRAGERQGMEMAAERDEMQLIAERDAAEDAFAEAYLLVIGESPEFSNRFGFQEALDEIHGKLSEERAAAAKLPEGDARDAARYRWLVSMAWGKPLNADCSIHELTFRTFSVKGEWESTKAVADRAIDAAMQHSPAKEK